MSCNAESKKRQEIIKASASVTLSTSSAPKTTNESTFDDERKTSDKSSSSTQKDFKKVVLKTDSTFDTDKKNFLDANLGTEQWPAQAAVTQEALNNVSAFLAIARGKVDMLF